jgi:hypothetical protein
MTEPLSGFSALRAWSSNPDPTVFFYGIGELSGCAGGCIIEDIRIFFPGFENVIF